MRLELRGLPLDDSGEGGRRRYTFEVACAGALAPPDVIEFDDLVRSWYSIGSHGGFGGWLNALSSIEHQREEATWRIRFSVDGHVTYHALSVLLRCLDVSDIDIAFSGVIVETRMVAS